MLRPNVLLGNVRLVAHASEGDVVRARVRFGHHDDRAPLQVAVHPLHLVHELVGELHESKLVTAGDSDPVAHSVIDGRAHLAWDQRHREIAGQREQRRCLAIAQPLLQPLIVSFRVVRRVLQGLFERIAI